MENLINDQYRDAGIDLHLFEPEEALALYQLLDRNILSEEFIDTLTAARKKGSKIFNPVLFIKHLQKND